MQCKHRQLPLHSLDSVLRAQDAKEDAKDGVFVASRRPRTSKNIICRAAKTRAVLKRKTPYFILKLQIGENASSGTFRSYGLGVMGPARFHCATLLKGGNDDSWLAKKAVLARRYFVIIKEMTRPDTPKGTESGLLISG